MILLKKFTDEFRAMISNSHPDISNLDDETFLLKLISLSKRVPLPKKRNIKKSKEFNCPSQLEDNLNIIERHIENGDNIIPYMHKEIKCIGFNNKVFNSLEAIHLHLGKEIKPNGFIERTGELLFAMFDDENVYFINIFNHNYFYTKDEDILTIIENNWPDLISKYKVEGDFILNQVYDDEQKKCLKELNIDLPIITKNGTRYLPTGGGSMGSGDNAESMLFYNFVIELLINKEKELSKYNDINHLINEYTPENKNEHIALNTLRQCLNVVSFFNNKK